VGSRLLGWGHKTHARHGAHRAPDGETVGIVRHRKRAAVLQNHAVLPNVFLSMGTDLRHIIDDIADQADDFLAEATDRKQGRAGIEEFITLEHGELTVADRQKVVEGVMAVLEAEDFFGTEFVGDPFADADEKEE